MPVSMTPYRVFPDYRHIDPAFFHAARHPPAAVRSGLYAGAQVPAGAGRRPAPLAFGGTGGGRHGDDPVQQPQSCAGGALLPRSGHHYEGHAGKPSPRGFRRAMARSRSAGGDGHAGRQAADGYAGREPGGRSAADGGAAGRAAGRVESCAARPAKAVEGRQPEKTPAALTFFRGSTCQTAHYHVEYTRPILGWYHLFRGNGDIPLIHNGSEYQYGNYYRR